MERTGVWLVGAYGNVATTAIVGARAIAHDVANTTGMVTARPPCTRLDLPDLRDMVFGGHDVRDTSLLETARRLSAGGVPTADVVETVADDLAEIDENVRVGTAVNCGRAVTDLADETLDAPDVGDVVGQIRDDYRSFADEHDLDRVVVVNVASTEPGVADPDRYDTLDAFERAVEANDRDLPASSLYAYAALVEGHPYVNFTPSTGAALGGLRELAERENLPNVGRDAKTGETLLKSTLAPMFAARNLRVRSWEGHNILGNDDGLVLENDANKAGKLASKGDVLEGILPDIEHNRVRIDYAPPLGDWKTAWDDIRFDGFLDTRMKLQFTWEGSDSALAAPLVLDLVRLVAHADEYDEGGLQPQLASFFKAPLGVDDHDFAHQFDLLERYVDRHAGEGDDGRVRR
ncbi:inositol-3-phosphate synthase [Halorarum halophilum]|uniref:Inositol-3-phosphate synthase n=1 Tax=Halorarum halophilum TaxID=2743090 RepID=A0A7D5KX50_9EURY|nr:inositol-3-phosphate synthase [Halobaculum halophilum]QLG27698.1 inositol-3-phosphate synthase [Halobaculum halophilum]